MEDNVVTLDVSEVAARLGIYGHITDVWTAEYATKIEFVVKGGRSE